jgi:hypothetical protein
MGIEKRTRGNIALIKDAQGNAFVINIMQIGANRSFIREVMGSLYYVMKVREPGFRDCNQGIGRRSYSCLCKPDQVATERRVLDNCLDLQVSKAILSIWIYRVLIRNHQRHCSERS